jgi:DNA modification methylase
MKNVIEFGDCRETMRRWAEQGVKVQTCVTSPPYFGLRDYGHDGQIGLEQTPEEYIAAMVEVFRCVRDVLADDGTLWLNIGDSYNAYNGNRGRSTSFQQATDEALPKLPKGAGLTVQDLKNKDLIGIPWMLAFALRADGWYLRQDIIWHKPNPMPESVRDRCTKAHEYIFLLSKSDRYYYDAEAIAQPLAETSKARLAQPNLANQRGSDRVPGKMNGPMKAVGPRFGGNKYGDDGREESRTKSGNEWNGGSGKANRRSVWSVATRPYKGAHFATFPPALIEPCILAGSRPGDIVLDPFMGSGTTAQVALEHGRAYLGCELNSDYKALQDERISKVSEQPTEHQLSLVLEG